MRYWTIVLALLCGGAAAADLSFEKGTFEGWTVEGESTWTIGINPPLHTRPDDPKRYVVNSYEKGEQVIGTLRSEPFVIEKPIQKFAIAGWDGTLNGQNDGDRNWVRLRSYPDGEILRRTHTPGGNMLAPVQWFTGDLIGRKVYVEVVDNNPVIRPGGFAWIAFADYSQGSPRVANPVKCRNLHALKIDDGAEMVICRSIPFLAQSPHKQVKTTRKTEGNSVTIPVGSSADTIYLLGMLNWGWDFGVAHWGEHPELREMRDDQIHIGSRIGELEIRYSDGARDIVPIQMGATAWWVAQWAYGPSHGVPKPVREPFISRPDCRAALDRSLKLRLSDDAATSDSEWRQQFLSIKPRAKKIESITVRDNPALRGRPLVSAITLSTGEGVSGVQSRDMLTHFGEWEANAHDLKPGITLGKPLDWSHELAALSDALYTNASHLPKTVKPIDFPKGLDAARIRFLGGTLADMLSNVWVANLTQMGSKFERDTGLFRETGETCPWYGGYSGIGTWMPGGVYSTWAFPRCSDHYATVALRCINDPVRTTNYVDICDNWFYFYRPNHDPDRGPPNPGLDVTRYPKDAPGHWAFILNDPMGGGPPINEIPGHEEMDGHGATAVARWMAWRLMGAPRGEWLTKPRESVYGKSRWDTTRDAAEFICWLMDYTGRDVMWNEGETTCWGANGVPPNMATETDPVKIKQNYANANMYEPYPTYTCLTALRCSAQIAEAMAQPDLAKKWRAYADRLREGMIRLFRVGDSNKPMWRVSLHSVYPSLQDSLVQAWFSIYYDGLDPVRLDPAMSRVSRNTLDRQLSQPYGYAAVLAAGYGQGWLAKSALILDNMDAAGPLVTNIAKYSYDKNMDYADPKRGIDWREWLWLIPEGTNILPDGSWHRIGDLTNGANQGPAMHALELCAGIDDTKPAELKIMPRAPKPLRGLEVSDFLVLVPDGDGLAQARVRYQFKRPGVFHLKSDRPLPTLAVRLGPFDETGARKAVGAMKIAALPPLPNPPPVGEGTCPLPNPPPQGGGNLPSPQPSPSRGGSLPSPRPSPEGRGGRARVEKSGMWNGGDAWWVWVEGLKDVSNLDIQLGK